MTVIFETWEKTYPAIVINNIIFFKQFFLSL